MVAITSTTVSLDSDTQARVQRLANARDCLADLLLQEAVEQYLEREEAREQLRQNALAAWADFQATGLHLTGEEADDWLSKLEAGEEVTAPECHP